MFMTRLFTAIVLIALLCGLLFYTSTQTFSIVVSLLTIAALWEWSACAAISARLWMRIVYVIIAAFLMFTMWASVPIWFVMLASAIWWCSAVVLIVCYPAYRLWSTPFIRGIMGYLTILPAWRALIYMRFLDDGARALLFILIFIWLADSVAYIVGKRFGSRKLAPLVSPGKTVEGTTGAWCATLIYVLCYVGFDLTVYPFSFWLQFILIMQFVFFFSVIGDLFESMIKRETGVKDSGKWLPGHGGILDRIDSLTAALPIFVGLLGLVNYFSG